MNEILTQTIYLKKRCFLLLLLVLLYCSYGLKAQVTVGSNTPPQEFSILEIVSNSNGGLRLPQLTATERDAITTSSFKSNVLAQGLAIFNTTTKCYEYFNNTRWVSLCKGEANITFTDESGTIVDPFSPDFICAGETRGPYTPHDTQACNGMSSPFSFLIMVGNSYTTIDVEDYSTGKFHLTMSPNSRASSRNAVLRITNNCTGEYKEFLFVQEGCTDICQPNIAKPIVNVYPSVAICSSGAVYMSINNPVDGAYYMWTLDGEEMTEYLGYTYAVAQKSGTYKVYVGGIGCETNASDPIKVTIDNNNLAPSSVSHIAATNNGVICSTASVKLTAYNVPSGATLTWYKNGVKTSKTGNPAILTTGDEGDWFAVMENAGCTSKPSNTITVTSDNTTNTLTDPVITVNDVDINTAVFCKGGYNTLAVTNMSAYTTGVTITWYDGTTLLGTGTPFVFTTPSVDEITLRCVVHDNTSTYCDAEVAYTRTLSTTAPSRPSIGGNSYICGGNPATLTTPLVTGASYRWYKNNALISGATTNTYLASEEGDYQVQIVDGTSCISQLSAATSVKLSAAPTVAFQLPQASAGMSEVVTYQVVSTQNPTSYIWTVNGGAVFLDGSNPNTQSSTTTSANMRVKMGSAAESIELTCIAVNHCGNSPKISQTIVVGDVCTPVSIDNITMSPSGTILVNTTVSLSATVSGTGPYTYQWKKDGSDISGATSAAYSFTTTTGSSGEYSLEVKGCNNSSATKVAGTITVIDNPPTGSGKLSGQDCFDVNQSNSNNECGLTKDRLKADFSQTYTYTFTNSGTGNTDLSWILVESATGSIVDYSQSVINNVSGALTDGGKYNITIKYNPALMNLAKGLTDDNPYTLKVLAVYKTNGTSYSQTLTVVIKDCRCGCSVSTTTGDNLTFMCYNLGADTRMPALEWNNLADNVDIDIKGYLYQWGRATDGHQKRQSAKANNSPSPTSRPSHGNFITRTSEDVRWKLEDWTTDQNLKTRWGSGTYNAYEDQVKGPNDPCPDGWRVPNKAEWQSLLNGATWEVADHGYLINKTLYLPFSGIRHPQDGLLMGVGYYAYYWSSVPYNTYYLAQSWMLIIGTDASRNRTDVWFRATGASVRCIKQ